MDTGIYTPRGLFQKAICYVIPPFQRSYVWKEEEQWEPLWDDIRNTAEAYLENFASLRDKRKAEQATPTHFLGAVVLKQELTSTGEIEQRIIVDGQQRITTLQLFLDAAKRVSEELQLEPAMRLSTLVRNDDRIHAGDDLLKLRSTRIDNEAFQYVMNGNFDVDPHSESNIMQVHRFFQARIRDWLDEQDDKEGRIAALEAAITSRVQLVVIDLDSSSDPHVIFETLNARGTPLLASDLIKNYVLSRTTPEHTERVWGDLGVEWWREDIQQGRLYRARIEVALNYWLIMRKAKEVLASNLFNEFKEHADSMDVEDVMKDVRFVLSKYRSFHTDATLQPAEKVFRDRLDTMQMGVVTPVLLLLLSSTEVPYEKRIRAFKAIESFLVRRMICRDTAKNYNRMMQNLLLDFRKQGMNDADKTTIQFLSKQEADAGEWPSDARIRESIGNSQLYRLLTRGRLRLVLEGIETELRSSMSEQLEVPKGLTIEHVMPQKWQENWPLPEGGSDLEDPASNRNRLIDTLGNLTLVTGRLNSSLSNAPWAQKRGTLQSHSNMSLNSELLSALQGTTWNEEAILDRSKRLTDAFINVWPGPDSPEWD